MSLIILNAYPKVNLTLRVVGKDDSTNLHHLQSVFCFLTSGVHDQIMIYEDVPFSADSAKIDNIPLEQNLLHRLYRELLESQPNIFFPHIEIQKNIPIGAGLGGGSSDVAILLHYLCVKNNIHKDDAMKIAARLGDDIPLFLDYCFTKNSLYWLDGTGRQLSFKPILQSLPSSLYLLVANNGAHISTAEIFSKVQPSSYSPNLHYGTDLLDFIIHSQNDLEKIAISIAPSLQNLKSDMESFQPLVCRMSGSGGSFLAIFNNEKDLTSATTSLQMRCNIIYSTSDSDSSSSSLQILRSLVSDPS